MLGFDLGEEGRDAVAPLEPHPHGQHEQDAGWARPHHPGALLPARRHCRMATDRQGN